MKRKILVFFVAVITTLCFGKNVVVSPELLKQKDKFSDIKLFESKRIYSDRNANIALLKDYENNPKAYKDNQLFPIAICYLTTRDFSKAKTVLNKLIGDDERNIIVLRTLGSVNFLMRDLDASIDAYKKAVSHGDEFSAIYCSSALTLAKRPAEIKQFLPILQKFAKTNLEALNVLITYTMRFKSPENEKNLKNTIKDVDARKVLTSANPESLRLHLRLYVTNPDIWTPSALVVPARAAALFEDWILAVDCYKKVLKAEPKNLLALRGMGLVHYRLGDVTAASNSIKKAYEYGDKDAAIDGVELFLLAKYRFIWDEFKDKIDVSKVSLDIRAGLIQYASTQKDCADMFYNAVKDSSSEPLFKDPKVRSLIRQCLDAYSNDARAKAVAERYFNATN
ncbi:MAG: hypothetical protein E7035_07755 [Verrucomicrobiaceae bacterium]|nr:hypothetical protein [Verrucomicrobiaceae bacterium]